MIKIVSTVLSFVLILQQPVFAAPDSSSEDSGSRSEVMQTQETSDLLAQTMDTEGREWSKETVNLLPVLFDLVEKLERHVTQVGANRGLDFLNEKIGANQIEIKDESTGAFVSYRVIDGERIPRIMWNEQVYLIVDVHRVDRNSKHLEQYITRVQFEAGKTGRNVNLIVLNDGETQVEYMPKTKPTQWKWWREYFISKYKKPSLNDFTMAVFTGVALHGPLTATLSYMKFKYFNQEFNLDPVLWTAAYSTVYGTFYSTIKNWAINSGTNVTQVLKQLSLSALFGYGLVLTLSDGSFSDRVASINIFTIHGASLAATIFGNGLTNNWVKNFWYQITRLREKARLNAGNLDFKSEWANKLFGWRKATIEGQLFYLIPWSINVISLASMAMTDWLKIPGTDISLPLYQLGSIPIAMYWSKKYARKLEKETAGDPDLSVWHEELNGIATELEGDWNESFGLKVQEVPRVAVQKAKTIGQAAKGLGSKCIDLLSGFKK